MDYANDILDAVISHPSLDSICFNNCLGSHGNGYDILRILPTSNRTFSIDLESNHIRTMGGTHISNHLATIPPLTHLFLADNHLTDNDAILIAEALKENTSLEHIDLGGNYITDVGRDALSNVFFDSASLNSVADSNQKCFIGGFCFGNIPENRSSRNS